MGSLMSVAGGVIIAFRVTAALTALLFVSALIGHVILSFRGYED